MILIAFFPLRLIAVIRSIFLFYLEAFIFGGLLLGTLFLKSSALNTINGALLAESPTPSPVFLIFGSIAATIITKYGFDFFESYSLNEKLKLTLEIVLNDQSCFLTALIDTGNSLKDPITNEPVIIVYYKAILDILPEELREVIQHDYGYEIFKNRIIKSTLKSRVRVIPYKALGVENGLLIGVKVDLVISKQRGMSTMIKEPVIAFYNMPISNTGDYQALTYPGIIRGDKKDEN
jgi:stage II sporulation protein GA (sporulation sigma-E factor processing peptidase)